MKKKKNWKNTVMNKDWDENILQEKLLPTSQEQFGPTHKGYEKYLN